MKNKLLLSTAIASLVTVGGIAHAETKVSGNLEQTYKAISDDASAGAASTKGLGAEYNIGLSSSKKLDNGLTATFGFNLEADSANSQAASADSHFLTIGTDAVSISIARDNGNNISATAIPHISDTAETVVVGGYDNLGTLGSDGHNDDHIRADIKGAGGTFTLRYVPSDSGVAGHSALPADTNSAYDIIYRGSLGVDGLSVLAGQHTVTASGTNQEALLRKYSVAYNFGKFAAGIEMIDSETEAAAGSQTTEESIAVSATYAVNDKLSIGFARYETDQTIGAVNGKEEVTNMISMGYSLGGIAFDVNYAQTENFNFGNTDRDTLQIRTIQKF